MRKNILVSCLKCPVTYCTSRGALNNKLNQCPGCASSECREGARSEQAPDIELSGYAATGTARPEDTYCYACDIFGHWEGSAACGSYRP